MIQLKAHGQLLSASEAGVAEWNIFWPALVYNPFDGLNAWIKCPALILVFSVCHNDIVVLFYAFIKFIMTFMCHDSALHFGVFIVAMWHKFN